MKQTVKKQGKKMNNRETEENTMKNRDKEPKQHEQQWKTTNEKLMKNTEKIKNIEI